MKYRVTLADGTKEVDNVISVNESVAFVDFLGEGRKLLLRVSKNYFLLAELVQQDSGGEMPAE